jgi:hypothetical protein
MESKALALEALEESKTLANLEDSRAKGFVNLTIFFII